MLRRFAYLSTTAARLHLIWVFYLEPLLLEEERYNGRNRCAAVSLQPSDLFTRVLENHRSNSGGVTWSLVLWCWWDLLGSTDAVEEAKDDRRRTTVLFLALWRRCVYNRLGGRGRRFCRSDPLAVGVPPETCGRSSWLQL